MSIIKAGDVFESVATTAFVNGVTRGTINEDSGCQVMARIQKVTGTAAMVIADVTTISYAAFNLDSTTPTTSVASGALVVANTMFDTLQTDARWSYDSTGYNFKHQLASTVFATGDARYRIEYLITPAAAGSQPFFMYFEITVLEAQTS